MEFNRRDLLKFFSAGAVIAPVVNGLTLESERVKLITTPTVEIVEPPKIVAVENIGIGNYDATIYLRERGTSNVIRWESTCHAVDINLGFGHMYHSPEGKRISLEFSGVPPGFKRWKPEPGSKR